MSDTSHTLSIPYLSSSGSAIAKSKLEVIGLCMQLSQICTHVPSYWYSFESSRRDKSNDTHITTPPHTSHTLTLHTPSHPHRVGDIMESVNGINLGNADHREAVRAVKETKGSLSIVSMTTRQQNGRLHSTHTFPPIIDPPTS